ncbi:hypothetical protein C5F64_17185 [Photobacterium damselae subsp. damselae]|nr:hypothetical protein C5F64_17185 [Photobacterium damselae subsp. damselae]
MTNGLDENEAKIHIHTKGLSMSRMRIKIVFRLKSIEYQIDELIDFVISFSDIRLDKYIDKLFKINTYSNVNLFKLTLGILNALN